MDTSHRYAYSRQGERSGKSLTRSRQGESGPSDFALLLIAVAAAGASQTGVLAFLPDLVREGLGESTVDSQGFHTAGLAAAHPVGALLLAPLWGWLADRYDYRILLRTTLVILALATTATGATPLAWLYVLRALAGACSAAIIPLALLAASLGAGDRGTQARRFTWLTAFVFLGDMLGPLFGELSTRFLPTLPLAMVALIVGLTAGLMLFACLPPRSTGYRAEACGNRPTPAGALGLLTLTLLGTSGLAVLHMVLLVPGSQLILSREHVAGMLALCGFAMLAAQLFHVYFPWLIASPRALAFLMLTLLSTSLLLFPMARSPVAIAVLVAMAGWAGASLRLLTSLWIGGEGTPSGARLGLQQSATSLGPALAPLAVAVISADRQFVIVWALALSSLMMTLGLSRLWPERGARFCSCPRH